MAATPMGPARGRTRQELLAEVRARVDAARARLGPGGAGLDRLVDAYYAQVGDEDLLARRPDELYAIVLAHWRVAQVRQPGEPLVRVLTPEPERDGWACPHSVVQVVTDDMPFLVDSVRMAALRAGFAIHLVVHPVVTVRRDAAGRLVEVCASTPGDGDGDRDVRTVRESWMHLEIDRHRDPDVLADLAEELRDVLVELRGIVDDHEAMRAQALEVAADLRAGAYGGDPAAREEEAALLEWLLDGNFTLIGAASYTAEPGEDLMPVEGTELGLLRRDADLAKRMGDTAVDGVVLVTKAPRRARVHRPAHLDDVRVQRVGPFGAVVATWRLLGLFTSSADQYRPWDIPVVRRKANGVMARAGLDPTSHSGEALTVALDTYPRDELFASTEDELYATALAVTELEERRLVRVFLRYDRLGAFWACQVYLPRDRYTTTVRRAIEDVLVDTLGGTEVEWEPYLSDSVLARLFFRVHGPEVRTTADRAAIEARVSDVTTAWVDQLRAALVEQYGEEEGTRLCRWADALPPAYIADTPARVAATDLKVIDGLSDESPSALMLVQPLEAPPDELRLRLYRLGPTVPLSDLLPVLQHLGVRVLDQRPYELHAADGTTVFVSDLGLRVPPGTAVGTDRLDAFEETFDRVWRGQADDDGFNRLVLRAGLDWRDVVVIRAYARYLRQIGTAFSEAYMEEVLCAHPLVTAGLVELFHTRLDPDRPGDAEQRAADAAAVRARIEADLEHVASLDEDRILRAFLALVGATLRTNLYVAGPGELPPALALKLDPRSIPDLPAPVPMFEVFVHAPEVDGVHLRAGPVARGGIRWSDRREDFRTEVLGLVKAQIVKNAVIVPTGAKGGFVLRRPPAPGDRDALAREGARCYRLFIGALLDITDNRVGGEVVPPARVVRHDGDDPYLVVAADKGTATFSDLANAIAMERGFWLGDAFASGGSTGYDHKAMGITARGAWESVRRHARRLGLDADTAPLTVVGIGDMSGDVFGNGLLRSPHVRLIAAFDHRHVFIDPDPDPAASFEERRRLFGLPRSSWDDYDRSVLSPGGGVYSRTAKRIELSPEARRALDIDAAAVTPPELVRAVLRAPVDLLWNGGIGTFVKARTESHADVGDRANDAIRVDGADLRARMVAEGGNLGFTQRARVEYALAGGLVNTDAIDNSAGVDCSDHEVNLKILLDEVVRAGDLTVKQRNELLASMTDEVAALVLADNADQTRALAISEAQAASMVEVHARLMTRLEQLGRLDRRLEALPDAEALAERRAAGRGLTIPELAVLMALVKTTLVGELLGSDLPDDPFLRTELHAYFPTAVQARFADAVQAHPLRREIVATAAVNRMVNQAGITFAFRMEEQTQVGAPDVVRAHVAAREIFGLDQLWAAIEALDGTVSDGVQVGLLLDVRRLAERAARWLLRRRPLPLDVAAAVATFSPPVRTLAAALDQLVPSHGAEARERRHEVLVAAGVPDALAWTVASLDLLPSALDVTEVALEAGEDVVAVGAVHFALEHCLRLDRLRSLVVALPRSERWAALAREAARDELLHHQRALVRSVLAATPAGPPDTAARVQTWRDGRRSAVERYLALTAELEATAEPGLAALTVALRELRALQEGAT